MRSRAIEIDRQRSHFAAENGPFTAAELVVCAARALRLDPVFHDPITHYMLMLDRVRDSAANFDILHFHIDQFHFPLFKSLAMASQLSAFAIDPRGDKDRYAFV